MKLSSVETLLASLPIIFVLIALIGAILFFPNTSNDIRGKASEIIPTVSEVTLPSPTVTPLTTSTPSSETACSELYSPVCGDNGVTFGSECEAGKAGVSIAHFGECQ